ncbi:MAG: NADP-dependent oxidoreductase [Oligoflexus sp.]
MKAITYDTFGDSSVLKISELPDPEPGRGEVLIRLSHTSVNPVDWKIRLGYLKDAFPHSFPIIPGWDASGEVIALGEDVDEYSVGELVYAYARLPLVQNGTYAEKIVLPANFLARKPNSINAAEAAAVPLVGLTAYQSLKNIAQLKAGEKALILGGAGGVGSFAVQFAKIMGAEVTATTSRLNFDYVRSLGADHVIDYTNNQVIEEARKIAAQGFDVIFDAVGGAALEESSQVLAQPEVNDRLVSIVETPKHGHFHFVTPSGEELKEIAALFDSGRLKLPAITVRSIKDAAMIQDENAQQHTRGKIVMTIDFA